MKSIYLRFYFIFAPRQWRDSDGERLARKHGSQKRRRGLCIFIFYPVKFGEFRFVFVSMLTRYPRIWYDFFLWNFLNFRHHWDNGENFPDFCNKASKTPNLKSHWYTSTNNGTLRFSIHILFFPLDAEANLTWTSSYPPQSWLRARKRFFLKLSNLQMFFLYCVVCSTFILTQFFTSASSPPFTRERDKCFQFNHLERCKNDAKHKRDKENGERGARTN